MGGAASSVMTGEEVDTYAELTYLKKREVIRAFSLFRLLDAKSVDTDWKVRLPSRLFRENLPTLQCNPFGERILNMFSSEEDGHLSFEDFLDMLSVFCRAAPDSLKTSYAFKLYDVDADSQLDRADLTYVLDRLTSSESSRLPGEERDTIIDNVLDECDIDRSGTISLQEFQHVVARCPDFAQAFSFELV